MRRNDENRKIKNLLKRRSVLKIFLISLFIPVGLIAFKWRFFEHPRHIFNTWNIPFWDITIEFRSVKHICHISQLKFSFEFSLISLAFWFRLSIILFSFSTSLIIFLFDELHQFVLFINLYKFNHNMLFLTNNENAIYFAKFVTSVI